MHEKFWKQTSAIDTSKGLNLDTNPMNISTPVASMFLLTPFHDFFRRKSCLGLRGRRGSTAGGLPGPAPPFCFASWLVLLAGLEPASLLF